MPETRVPLRIALAGNPNTGKTTVFNGLTGARQQVANYPGVTVECATGRRRCGDHLLEIVDLPGTYSLSAASEEERLARHHLTDTRPDATVVVVDASNLERNLYLVLQVIEMGLPVVVALNMVDLAGRRGIELDVPLLAGRLGCPVVPTVGSRRRGLDDLLEAVVAIATTGAISPVTVDYGPALEGAIAELARDLGAAGYRDPVPRPRWVATKLLMGDADVLADPRFAAVGGRADALQRDLSPSTEDGVAPAVTARRYAAIARICAGAVAVPAAHRPTLSDRVDRVLTHRYLGLPVFFGLMFLLFHLTFTLGGPSMDWIATGVERLQDWLTTRFPLGGESVLLSLLRDGVVGGVGGVLIFVPNIVLLFLAITVLESSGYMARAALIMDRLMDRLGLHGKSFVPMLLGFGCSVPAIMATRTLENRRDRLVTMLILPLMSCGARLPIYALLIPAFFPRHQGLVLFGIYLIGILLAILGARLLRSFLLKGDNPPFILELPPYRLPTLRTVVINTGQRTWLYLKKAGTVILAISVVLWALASYPAPDGEALAPLAARREAAVSDLLDGSRPFLPGGGRAARNLILARVAHRRVVAGVPEDHPGRAAVARQRDRAIAAQLGEAAAPAALAAFLEAVERLERLRAAWADEVAAQGWRPAAWTATLADGDAPGAAALRRDQAVLAWLAARLAYEREKAALAEDPTGAVARDWLDGPWEAWLEREAAIDNAIARTELEHSAMGRFGRALGPLMRPMGFDWRIATAMVGAFAAKEVFVAQMGVAMSVGEADETSGSLQAAMASAYSPLVAFCIMLFALISTPCMATIAVTRRESNSWKWALFQLVGLTALAWVLTTAVYQVGVLLGAAP